MLDYMTRETQRRLSRLAVDGPTAVQSALENLIPEYRSSKGKVRVQDYSGVFASSLKANSQETEVTPTKNRMSMFQTGQTPLQSQTCLQPFTVSQLLEVDSLRRLATLIVDFETRRQERQRRRRIRDGVPKAKDLQVEAERKAAGIPKDEYRLTPVEKEKTMVKLAAWGIRHIAEEGSLIQVQLSPLPVDEDYTKTRLKTTHGYLPLPPSLIFQLLVPHFRAEKLYRQRVFLPKADPRSKNGMTVDEVVKKMRGWANGKSRKG
jgi:hypothetical protein